MVKSSPVKDKIKLIREAEKISQLLFSLLNEQISILDEEAKKNEHSYEPADYVYRAGHLAANFIASICVHVSEFSKTYKIDRSPELTFEWITVITKEAYIRETKRKE